MLMRIAALIAFATSFFAMVSLGAQIPRPSPEFVFNMGDGSQQLLSMYKGKPIVLALLYATCPHCQKTAQVLTQVQKEYAAKGVQVVGAVFQQGDASRVGEFRNALGLNFPVGVSDERTVLEYLQHPVTEPYFVPGLVFIDKRFVIRAQYLGDENFLHNQEAKIRAEIDKLLRTPIAPKTPKS